MEYRAARKMMLQSPAAPVSTTDTEELFNEPGRKKMGTYTSNLESSLTPTKPNVTSTRKHLSPAKHEISPLQKNYVKRRVEGINRGHVNLGICEEQPAQSSPARKERYVKKRVSGVHTDSLNLSRPADAAPPSPSPVETGKRLVPHSTASATEQAFAHRKAPAHYQGSASRRCPFGREDCFAIAKVKPHVLPTPASGRATSASGRKAGLATTVRPQDQSQMLSWQ
jgi:hypothetical protein